MKALSKAVAINLLAFPTAFSVCVGAGFMAGVTICAMLTLPGQAFN